MAKKDSAVRDDSVKTSLKELKQIEAARLADEEAAERLRFEEARQKAEETKQKALEAEERRKQEEAELRKKKADEEARRKREEELAEKRMEIEERVRREAELEKERIRAEALRPKASVRLLVLGIVPLILATVAVGAFAFFEHHSNNDLRADIIRLKEEKTKLKTELDALFRSKHELSEKIAFWNDMLQKFEARAARAEAAVERLQSQVSKKSARVTRKRVTAVKKDAVPAWKKKGVVTVDPNTTDPLGGIE